MIQTCWVKFVPVVLPVVIHPWHGQFKSYKAYARQLLCKWVPGMPNYLTKAGSIATVPSLRTTSF